MISFFEKWSVIWVGVGFVDLLVGLVESSFGWVSVSVVMRVVFMVMYVWVSWEVLGIDMWVFCEVVRWWLV